MLSSRQIASCRTYSFIVFLLAASLTISTAQELVHLPFSQSFAATKQAVKYSPAETLNSNPLLADYDVKFYGLDVEVDNRSDKIEGSTTIVAETRKKAFSTLVFELYRSLDIKEIFVDGTEMSFTHTEDEVYIDLEYPRDSGIILTALIYYGGQTGGGMVMEVDEEWGVPVTYTSSEPFYSKDWFPCKENLEDKADSVHVFITTDYDLMGVSQGIHSGTTYFPDGKVRYEWKSNYPIAFYLISIAVADYVEYEQEVQPPGIDAPIYIQNFLYDVPGCLDLYLDPISATLPIMEVFCQHFGPYPFLEEKYGHYLWPRGGGMEHQTMTGMGHFEFYLVAHELGHSWFGNYVTCANWQDIWINEGFATFAGYLATEVLGPGYAAGERAYRFDRALSEPDGTVYIPEEDVNDASRIFSGNLSYNKGMALLYMMRFELQDDELFYLALRNFLDRYADDVATGLDFKEVLEETTGVDFTDFFDQWYFGAGYPVYDVSWEQEGSTLSMQAIQSTSSLLTPLFKMSMEYTIFHEGGDTTVRVFQGENLESYEFDIPYTVTDIVIDPENHVLDGISLEKKVVIPDEEQELFSLYPNPARGSFFFSASDEVWVENSSGVRVEILDLTGKVLYRKSFRACGPFMEYAIELQDGVKGICLARFHYENRIEVHKILVE